MDTASGLSLALEDYLEAMLDLDEKESEIRVTDIAKKLNITKATVSQTMTRLKKMGMIDQDTYGPVYLTTQGKKEARKVRGRHRIIRDFLIKVLDLDEKTAQRDACLMEHVLSSLTISKLSGFLSEFVSKK
jgi:DtxR family transcriptional regulator, Mn-dependent transcriptional regulator